MEFKSDLIKCVATVMCIGIYSSAVCLQYACARESMSEKDPENNTICAESVDGDVALSITYDKEYNANGAKSVLINIANRSEVPIQYIDDPIYALGLYVEKDGFIVPYTRLGERLFAHNVKVYKRFFSMSMNPGESLSLTIDVSRYFDLTIYGDYILKVIWREERGTYGTIGHRTIEHTFPLAKFKIQRENGLHFIRTVLNKKNISDDKIRVMTREEQIAMFVFHLHQAKTPISDIAEACEMTEDEILHILNAAYKEMPPVVDDAQNEREKTND